MTQLPHPGAPPSLARLTLYPELEPWRTGRLSVSPVHELYFEESGNPRWDPTAIGSSQTVETSQ